MSTLIRLRHAILEDTFEHFRACGQNLNECQALWVSSWDMPDTITEVVHPKHAAHLGGFELDDSWLNKFWLRLASDNLRIRAQVHTHPGAAFHSETDNNFPIIHKPGFLSLVIPRFARGPVGFAQAYLTEIQLDGTWREIPISSRLVLE